MSDLINRSRVIENIWDVFNSYANDSLRFDEYETEAINKAFTVLQKTIERQQTAYDVEKVVEELERWSTEVEIILPISKNTIEINVVASGNAIDIVKRGGME